MTHSFPTRSSSDLHQRKAKKQHAYAFGVKDYIAEKRLLQRHDHCPKQFGENGKYDRAQNDARYMPHAAQHHHAQHHDRFGQAETFGADKALHGSEHGASHTTETGPHGKGQQLDIARVDPHGLGSDLVFAHGFPGPAYAGILQAHADDDDEDDQQQEQVIIFFGPRNSEADRKSTRMNSSH